MPHNLQKRTAFSPPPQNSSRNDSQTLFPPTSQDRSHTGAIAGGVTGGVVGIALLIILAYFLARRHHRKKEFHQTSSNRASSTIGTGASTKLRESIISQGNQHQPYEVEDTRSSGRPDQESKKYHVAELPGYYRSFPGSV